MHKLLTSQRQTREMMYGFEESATIGRQQLTNHKTEKGAFFCEHQANCFIWVADQEKVTNVLGCTLTSKRYDVDDPIMRNNGVDAVKIVEKDFGWYLPQFTPSLENKQFMMDQLLSN